MFHVEDLYSPGCIDRKLFAVSLESCWLSEATSLVYSRDSSGGGCFLSNGWVADDTTGPALRFINGNRIAGNELCIMHTGLWQMNQVVVLSRPYQLWWSVTQGTSRDFGGHPKSTVTSCVTSYDAVLCRPSQLLRSVTSVLLWLQTQLSIRTLSHSELFLRLLKKFYIEIARLLNLVTLLDLVRWDYLIYWD